MTLVSVTHLAKRFKVTKNAVQKWRARYPDFPEPASTDPYPQYRLEDVERWYLSKWAYKDSSVTIHRYRIDLASGPQLTSTEFGPWEQARGYLQGIREVLFKDWRVYSTPDGFSAHLGDSVEVWVLDPTTAEPEPWYVYDARFKAGGKAK